jgi:glutamyl-tRNA synthetase
VFAFAPLVQIDEWVAFAERIGGVDGGNEEAALAILSELNSHFTLRTFAAAHHVTLADVALWHAVRRLRGDADAFSNKHKLMHLRRWFAHCNALPLVAGSATGSAARNVTQAKQRVVTKAGAMGSFDKIEVSGARLSRASRPSRRAICTSGTSRRRCSTTPTRARRPAAVCTAASTTPIRTRRRSSLRTPFSTTSPRSTSGPTPCRTRATSLASLSSSPRSSFATATRTSTSRRRRRCARSAATGVESACRAQSVDENLRLWGEMVEGTALGLTCVLRAKIDMKCANLAMRDPAIYRCKLAPHHRTGTKFKVYPMYDFACPIIDSLEGITHALRSSEYTSRNPLYEWVADQGRPARAQDRGLLAPQL